MNRKPKLIRACTVSESISFVAPMIPELLREYEVCVLASPGKYWDSLDRYGEAVRRIEVPMERHISPMRDLRSLWRLVRVFRRERPTMVHSMTPKAGLLCMMAAWLCRVPVRVHTFTGLVFPTATGLTRRILMLTDSITCACATHIIPEGEGVRADLLNHGITRKPIRVLGYGNCRGIDLQRFDPSLPEVEAAAASLRLQGVFTFVFVGRLVRDKGINELVAAFERLHSELPATRLILVGPEEPELDPLLPETVLRINNNPAIEAPGSQSDVRPWLAAADALVFPSYREGFPNVVIEAGAMGLPSIVTDINGSREIISDGVNGVIIPPRNADALYSAMRRMATSPELAAAMAANARPRIAARYEQEFVRRCLLDFYKKILPQNDRNI